MAFELLAAGKFEIKSNGHFGVLSKEYWGDVLTSYSEYLKKQTQDAQKQLGSLDPDQERILTPEELDEKNEQAIRSSLLESWHHFKTTGQMMLEPSMDGMGAMHYGYLREKKLLPKPSEETAEAIKTEAEEYIKNEYERQRLSAGKFQLKDLAAKIAAPRQQNKFKSTCAKIGVRVFFEDLIIIEADLEKMLES